MNSEQQIEQWLEEVKDPEIPVLSIKDIGILRKVAVKDENHIEIVITPTYTGCPAMIAIEEDIKQVLKSHGVEQIKLLTEYAPPWSTDSISEEGRKKLLEFGISPPLKTTNDKRVLMDDHRKILCPQCRSYNTELISPFGSTACKALYRCMDCKEPFDYFKCH